MGPGFTGHIFPGYRQFGIFTKKTGYMQRSKNMRGAVGTLLQTGDQFTEIAADPSPGLQGKNGVIKENAHNTTSVGFQLVVMPAKAC